MGVPDIRSHGGCFFQPLFNSRCNSFSGYNYRVFTKKAVFFSVLLVLLTGCDVTPVTPTVSLPAFVTATLPPTSTAVATSAPQLPTAAPTIALIPGRTTTEVNLRQDTSTASPSLGTIPAFTSLQVTGKDASGLWVQVLYDGKTGWVRADYVQADDASAQIPVLGAGTGEGSSARGVVLRGVNVRSGPGTTFDSIGLLNQNDVVPVLGRDSSSAWFQVQYTESTGWIAAEFLQVENAEALPVVNAAPQATEAVEAQPQTEPASQTALPDNDSASAPLVVFKLGDNIQTALFQGEVSSPNGDSEDWVGFSSNSKQVVISISCNFRSVQVELMKPDRTTNVLSNECEQSNSIQVQPGQAYLLRISPLPTDQPAFRVYQIRIEIVIP